MDITTKHRNILPGFSLSMGITISTLGFLVCFPIVSMIGGVFHLSFEELIHLISRPAAVSAFLITLQYSFFAAIINSILGFIIAWTIVRYRFPGVTILDAIVDIPFALPGAVGGIALASVFGEHGIIGSLFHSFGISLIYNQLGILIGLIFVTLPFSVRTVQPLIKQLDKNEQEAAVLLGANNWNIFYKVQLPILIPGICTGFILSFARALGEYGTVIFIAGNIPLKSEVISHYIYSKIDQYDMEGAIAVASILLFISFTLLFSINLLQKYIWRQKNE